MIQTTLISILLSLRKQTRNGAKHFLFIKSITSQRYAKKCNKVLKFEYSAPKAPEYFYPLAFLSFSGEELIARFSTHGGVDCKFSDVKFIRSSLIESLINKA